jgi:hypothetical protein
LPSKETAEPYLSLPAVDDPASAEVGVILMGLDGEQLLAGLGIAALADDPTLVTLVVDRLRHTESLHLPIAAGTRRWRSARIALGAVEHADASPSAAVRQAWANAARAVTAADIGEPGPARHAYLTACWLRRSEVDRCVEERRALPEVAG